MIRALVISSLLASGALGLSVQNQLRGPADTDTCDKQHDELLKSYDGNYLGSSLKFGKEDMQVSWETASKRVITNPYVHKNDDYAADTAEPTVQFGYNYGLEPSVKLENGFETVEVAGCAMKKAPVSEMQSGSLSSGATAVGGLRPIPGEASHVLLGQRAPRVSFCFPQDTSMDGRLVWGAPDPRGDGAHVTLNIAGGMKAHHWAVNVTGMGMSGIDASGNAWSKTVLDEHREKVANDKTSYWIAVFSTGQKTLVVPKEVLEEVKKHMDPFNLVDCTNTTQLPSLVFELDGQKYTVSPKDYLIDAESFKKQTILHESPLHFRPKLSEVPSKDSCVVMFAPPTPFEGVFVLGQPFLRKHATTYDFEKRQIITVPHEGSCWSGATRSYATFTYILSFISLAMSFGSVL